MSKPNDQGGSSQADASRKQQDNQQSNPNLNLNALNTSGPQCGPGEGGRKQREGNNGPPAQAGDLNKGHSADKGQAKNGSSALPWRDLPQSIEPTAAGKGDDPGQAMPGADKAAANTARDKSKAAGPGKHDGKAQHTAKGHKDQVTAPWNDLPTNRAPLDSAGREATPASQTEKAQAADKPAKDSLPAALKGAKETVRAAKIAADATKLSKDTTQLAQNAASLAEKLDGLIAKAMPHLNGENVFTKLVDGLKDTNNATALKSWYSILSGVVAGWQAHDRGVSKGAVAADATVVGLLSAFGKQVMGYKFPFGEKLTPKIDPGKAGLADAAIQLVYAITSVFSPEAAKYVGMFAKATPSETAKGLATNAIDVIDAGIRGDGDQLVRQHGHQLSGKYGEAVRGYSIFYDAAGAAAVSALNRNTRQNAARDLASGNLVKAAQNITDSPDFNRLSDAAAAGKLGMWAKLGDWLGGTIFSVIHRR